MINNCHIMDTQVLVNYRKICRTCLKQCESRKALISLFDYDKTCTQEKIKYSYMLETISSQNVLENDSLPNKVCLMCISQIRTSYYFKIQVEDSLNTLQQNHKQRQLELHQNHIPFIKQEPSTSLPLILSPRTLQDETFDDAEKEENMLDEISTSINENFNSSIIRTESDNEIIDYEPDMNDYEESHENEDTNLSEPSKSPNKNNGAKGKSPDSGISQDKSIEGSSKDLKCNVCSRNFDSLKSLVLHKRGICSITKCRFCPKKYNNIGQLKLHTRYKHPEKYNELKVNFQIASVNLERITKFHECTTCGTILISKIALLRHHSDCDNKCIECGLKIPRKEFYFKHLETVHKLNADPSSLECPFCMNTFHSERILQEHIQRLHPDENQSEQQSYTDTMSETGESTSNESFLFECNICQARFKSSRSLNQHKGIKHKDDQQTNHNKPKVNNDTIPKYSKEEFFEKFIVKKSNDFYRCLPCKKEIFKRSLMMHLKSKHAAVRCYRCELCSEAFFRVDYRQRHFSYIHPNDYKCFDCDLQFDRAYKFDAHMSEHGIPQKHFKPNEGTDRFDLPTNDIKYIEDSSNYDYSLDDALIKINNESVDDTPASNDVPMTKDEFCEKYITSVSDLMVNCSVCQQEIQKASLISHMLWKHAVKKPLKCPFCNERVVKNNARLTHMARCHPDAYKCSVCNIQFAKHALYIEHMWEFHSMKINTPASSGEEEDLQINEMYFITNRNEDEIIIEPDNIDLQEGQTQEKKYGCQHCSKKFTSNKNLLIHKSHKHRNETLEPLNAVEAIMETSDSTMTYEEFQDNWVEVINENDIKCLVCDQALKKKSFIPHIKHKHCTAGAYLCAICPERFYRPEQRTQHMSQNHRGIFYCNTCNIQFYRNSRYAKHMSSVHGIDLDGHDNYEVDLNLADLRFEATVRRSQDDDSLPSIVHEAEENDPIEEMMQQMSNNEEFSRNEFMRQFIKGNRNERHCLACNRTFYHSSIYHHIIHFHAAILPFKCPFCDVRFERTYTRNRHMQLFHPKEYKCFECGLQFPKHSKYTDHMYIEHNVTVSTQKSPLEEEDLSSTDIKYVRNKSSDDNMWQEIDDNPVGNSTMLSEFNEKQSSSSSSHQHYEKFDDSRVQIKNEPIEGQTISMKYSFAEKLPRVEELKDEYLYEDFKKKYLRKVDQITLKCLACNKSVIRTSVCAHLRLWHASSMMFNCELCDVGFRRSDYRQRHMASIHPNDHKCIKCQLQFHHSSLYKEHMYEAHRITLNVKMLKRRDEVDVPLENMMFSPRVPENQRVHPADENSKRGRRLSISVDPINPNAGGITYEDFQKNYIEELNESFYKCKICDETLSKFALKKHTKRFHATSKPYNCELCDKGFHRLDERLTHMQDTHPNSFKCTICNLQFYMSENYIEHMQNMHKTKVNINSNKSKADIDVPIQRLRFVPRRVNESSTTTSTIVKSEKSKKNAVDLIKSDLPDDAEMTRDQFSKKFLRAFRGKDGELLLKCSACNKQFAAKHKFFHLLHNHVIVRPFGCELCDMRFYSNFKRLKHIEQRHPNDFKCQFCNTQFEKSQIYAAHMLNEHKINVRATESANVDIPNCNLLYLKNPKGIRVNWRRGDASTGSVISVVDESDNSNLAPSETLYCDICNIDFDSARSYRQHIRDHGSSSEPLKIQDKSIKEEKSPKPIMQKQSLFQCEFCDKKVLTLFALKMHKKFKHGIGNESVSKSKEVRKKFEVECQMCSFSSYRRDYVEHHIKQCHKLEFQCRICSRITSNFNFYLYHLYKNHNIREDSSKYFKCEECNACFKFDENLKKHIQAKHGVNEKKRHFFCETCCVDFCSKSSLESHLEMYTHKHMYSYLNDSKKKSPKSEKNYKEIVSESENGNSSIEEPPEKRQKFLDNVEVSEDDKLEYLKYMQMTSNGHFKCGICGKVKALRKYMLHHLKQHKEVPTYECEKCSERFVFKKKYEQHLEFHENDFNSSRRSSIMIDNDDANFKASSTNDHDETTTEAKIQCDICHITFKLKIMLNRHNLLWHAEDNPYKELNIHQQKLKKSGNGETSFENNKIDQKESVKLKCEKCSLVFDDAKFFENHQKFFCVHRNQANIDNQSLNEQ